MAENNGLTWDQIPIEDEHVSKEDAAAADKGGLKPKGKYRSTCVGTYPETRHFNKSGIDCVVATLKWRIDEVVEIEGKVPVQEDVMKLVGQFIFDSVNMHHAAEEDWSRNRRLLVAKRTGCKIENGGVIPKDYWTKGIIGKSSIITLEHETRKDKNENSKTYAKVPFAGYEAVDTALATSAAAAQAPKTVDQYADI